MSLMHKISLILKITVKKYSNAVACNSENEEILRPKAPSLACISFNKKTTNNQW